MNNREQTIGVVLIVAALALTGAAVGYVFANWQPELSLDADRCPPKPHATWLAGVDHTDLWPPTERERIIKSLRAIAERMHKHERLDLHVMTGEANDTSTPWQGFQKCKSADPSSVNAAHDNERFVRDEFERDFLTPLERVLPDLAKGRQASQSPILEAIEIMLWSPHFRADVPARTLILYSDFLSSKPLGNLCTTLISNIGTRLKGHTWQGVRVILEYLRNPRDAARQGATQLRHWARLFYLLGAAEVFDGTTLIPNDASPCQSPATNPTRPPRNVSSNRNR